MSSRVPKLAAVTAAAAALAGGGYALGSQSDGSAQAAKAPARAAARPCAHRRPGPPFAGLAARRRPLAGLAARLGVSPAKLRSAFQTMLAAQRQARLDADAATLAAALHVDKAKVAAALAKRRPGFGPGAPPPAPRGWPGRRLGHRFGRHAWPGGQRFGRRHAPGAGMAAALAKELGVSRTDARAALLKLRAQRVQQLPARRDALATALAKQLGLDPARVKAALGRPHTP